MSIYRILERVDGGDWQVSAGGRIYRTLGTARGIITQMKRRYRYWDGRRGVTREFKIQESATEWRDA